MLGTTERWQGPFLVLAAAGLLGAAAAWAMVPDADAEAALQASQRTKFTFRRLGDQLTATNILLLFVVAVNGIAIYSFIALFSTFLREERHLALERASPGDRSIVSVLP